MIKLDKLFLLDSCTEQVLGKALLSADKSFNDQLARAQRFKPVFTRRDACEFYMILLAGLQINLPPYFKLRMILDPDCTTFPGNYAFQKCFERRKKQIFSDDESLEPEEKMQVRTLPELVSLAERIGAASGAGQTA